MSTGQKIKELRLRRNLTQEYMADQLGMSQQGYGKIENDKTEPSLSHLKKIAKELGVSVGHLAEDDALIFNNYGEIKEGGNGNVINTYHQQNVNLVEVLQNELKLWQEKYQRDTDYYKSIIDRLMGQS